MRCYMVRSRMSWLLKFNHHCLPHNTGEHEVRPYTPPLLRCLILWMGCLCLTGCMTITNQIQNEVTAVKNYPAAPDGKQAVSTSPPMVNIHDYQSVEDSPLRPYQRSDLAVAVAVSGGGYRASNLTAGVLLGLEKYREPTLKGNLLEEVDYFSTVSGGGFAVGYYLAHLNQFLKSNSDQNPLPHYSFAETLAESLGTPAVLNNNNIYMGTGNVLNINQENNIELGVDHYDSYETTINDGILNSLNGGDLTLGDSFIALGSKEKPRLPLWVVNATIYQNMAIMPFTPKVLEAYQVNSYEHLGQLNQNLNQNNFPYSVALAASSSVPFAMRSVTLGSSACSGGCYLQLFDGGLSDNLGVVSAYDMLMQDPAPMKLLIVIDAGKEHPSAFSQNQTPPGVFSLLWQVMNSGIEASRILVRNNVRQFASALLCQSGASNVLVAYLDLSHDPEVDQIPTSLTLTSEQQQELLQVGQSLVAQNVTLQQALPALLNGNHSVGACPAQGPKNGAYQVSMLD